VTLCLDIVLGIYQGLFLDMLVGWTSDQKDGELMMGCLELIGVHVGGCQNLDGVWDISIKWRLWMVLFIANIYVLCVLAGLGDLM